MAAEITVNGVQVHGLTKTGGRSGRVPKIWAGEMKVSSSAMRTADLPNPMEVNVDAVIEKHLRRRESMGLYRGGLTVSRTGSGGSKALKPQNGMWSQRNGSDLYFTWR